MNTMMQPEKMPLIVCGITTLKIVVSMLAPDQTRLDPRLVELFDGGIERQHHKRNMSYAMPKTVQAWLYRN